VKSFPSDKIRNIGLFGHQGAGKTSLADAMLFLTGGADRHGKVDDGHSQLDFDPEEVERRMTISAALAPCLWKDHKVNVLDTPGFFDFVHEVVSALEVVEGAVLVASAVSPVEVGLEKIWDRTQDMKLPRILYFNKMDKENADFNRCLDECAEKLPGSRIVPLQLPIGAANSFQGVINLVTKKAYKLTPDGKSAEIPIPDAQKEQVDTFYGKLVEEAAEATEELMEKYLETLELSDAEVQKGLFTRIRAGEVVPALCGASTTLRGVSLLLDAILEYIPEPSHRGEVKGVKPGTETEVIRKCEGGAPFCARAFKTTSDPYVGKLTYLRIFSGSLKPDSVLMNGNKEKEEKVAHLFVMKGKKQDQTELGNAGDIIVVAKLQHTETGDTLSDKDNPVVLPPIPFPTPYFQRSIFPKSKGDEDKLSSALARILQEDPTLKVRRDPETRETVLSSVGDQQIEICLKRLGRAGVEVDAAEPKLPYRETIRTTVKKQGRHKKQTGGRGQFADCWLEIAPLPRGTGFEFHDKVVGGVIPRNFIPAVEKGVRKALEEGFLAGYQVMDVSVSVYDGSFHPVDSSDMAFQIAGSMAFKSGAQEAKPALLEPVVDVEVTVPDSFLGDVIGDINSKRGKLMGTDPAGKQGLQVVKARVPQAEMMRYAIDLRSITQGRGSFKMTFSHYEEAPPNVADTVIAAAKAAAAAAE